MNKLKKSDLLSLEEFNSNREQLRDHVLTIKKDRKIQIGKNVNVFFENSDTVKFQVLEILKVKNKFEQNGIEEELAKYNSLIPDGTNLKATMLIEFPSEIIKKDKLSQLNNIENNVWLQVGENDRIFAVAVENSERAVKEKTSSLHFLCFEFGSLMIKDLQSGSTLFAGIDHPNYNVRTQEIPRTTSDSLAQDLV